METEIDRRISKILEISDRQEKAVSIRQLMDEFESGTLTNAKSTSLAMLGDRCVSQYPELGIECYYMSMHLGGITCKQGKEAPVHDIDIAVYNALSSPGVNTPELWKAIEGIEKKYDIRLFPAKR